MNMFQESQRVIKVIFWLKAVQELGENVPKCGEQLRAEVPKAEDRFQELEQGEEHSGAAKHDAADALAGLENEGLQEPDKPEVFKESKLYGSSQEQSKLSEELQHLQEQFQ